MCDPEVDHIGIMAYAAYFRNFKPSKTPAERVVMSSPPKNVYVGSEVDKTFALMICLILAQITLVGPSNVDEDLFVWSLRHEV